MAARAVILGCRGPELGPDERRFFADANPWGFILFGRNIAEPTQVRRPPTRSGPASDVTRRC